MSRGKRCFFIVGILISNVIFANDESSKLVDVISKIQNVTSLLHKHQSEQVSYQKELQKTEVSINQLSQKLSKTTQDLNNNQRTLSTLTSQQQKIEQRIKKQQQILLQQIRMTYLLGLNKNKFQYLLQAKDPDKINRLLTYNRYLSLHIHHLMMDLKTDLISLKNNKDDIADHANYLAQLKKNQLSQQKELDSNKHSQQAVLKTLSEQVKSHTEQLKELEKNKKNLEGIIAKLQKKKTYSSDYLNHHTAGRFPWPTPGKIIEKFGSAIQKSELKQNGVLIAAPEGQQVHAVAPGRVIFATWMPGYGLLMIIDHGKGYMTLYGNNGVLYKKEHDLVKQQELIATVGHTGGQQKPGLYFALRLNGKPIDPATWCH